MSIKGFLKKAVFFIPLIGGWYASKNPSSREAINVVIAVVTSQFGRGLTREEMLAKLDAEFRRRGFSEDLVTLTRVYAAGYLDKIGLK